MDQNIYDLLIGGPAADRSLACLDLPGGQNFTYADVAEHSGRIAHLLASSGIMAGD